MPRKNVRHEMKEIVEEYHKRTQTKAEFCKEKGLSASKLTYWVCRFNKEQRDSGSFVEIVHPGQRSGMLVMISNGIEIECQNEIGAEMLEQLLNYTRK